jgi:hypothetical protein
MYRVINNLTKFGQNKKFKFKKKKNQITYLHGGLNSLKCT